MADRKALNVMGSYTRANMGLLDRRRNVRHDSHGSGRPGSARTRFGEKEVSSLSSRPSSIRNLGYPRRYRRAVLSTGSSSNGRSKRFGRDRSFSPRRRSLTAPKPVNASSGHIPQRFSGRRARSSFDLRH